MTVGNRIKKRRKELEMSQRTLSEKMGYSNHSTITRIENDQVDLPLSKVEQFAKVLGVSPSYLMGWDEEPEERAEFEASILKDRELVKAIRDYMKLNDEQRKAVRTMISAMASAVED